ncbi:hypothetical protein CYMTET_8318 [Cymbomonas tetramitiformis]|uniref:Uncharacterized protein n=1 Tax=Cymbomonas tetramitiformis TaxID=36881 RepID=A0AAE0GTR3_9CHLO|nr:hypothetical protein CYMTET_8318 [Cymbomonas tetramitiformis]
MASEGQQEQRETRNQQEPDQTGWDIRVPSQETEEPQDGQLDTALQATQEMELPETQGMSMDAHQDAEDELIAMTQQQEEAQEELRIIREMAQQQTADFDTVPCYTLDSITDDDFSLDSDCQNSDNLDTFNLDSDCFDFSNLDFGIENNNCKICELCFVDHFQGG